MFSASIALVGLLASSGGEGAELPSTQTTTTSSISAAELAEIARALGADAAPAPPPAPAPSPSALAQLIPDIAVILDVALAAFSGEHLQTGGHDPSDNGFNLQALELSLHSSVDPYLRFDANIVFSLEGVEVEEAYGTATALPGHLEARFGQLLTRFGRQNPTHPHAWDFADQPFALGRIFGGDGSRGLGVELSWLTPLPWYVELLGSSTMAVGEGTARSFLAESGRGVKSPLDLLNVVALKQFFPFGDDLSLALGLGAATGPNATGEGNRSDVYGADLYLKYRPITAGGDWALALQSEWLYRRRQVPGDLLSDLSGYAQLVWRIDPRFGAAARWELGTPARGADAATIDDLDPEWTSTRQRVSASATWWPTEFSRFRLQGSIDLPRWREGPVYAGFLTGELVVGAHGAHAF